MTKAEGTTAELDALNLKTLKEAIESDACAIRVKVDLSPSGGDGDKVFPSTYIGTNDRGKEMPGAYAIEERRIGDRVVKSVLLDSVASQANRMEQALLDALDSGEICIPIVQTKVASRRITSLETPHRLADAIFRDCTLGGQAFRKSSVGESWVDSNMRDATAMYRICPTALLFGQWDSTGLKSGVGNKFQRVLVSEVVANEVETGVKVGGRVDPLQINLSVKVYKCSGNEVGWTPDEDKADKDPKGNPILIEKGRPSEINHGNIAPTISAGGVTFKEAIQTTALSLTGLRKLRFPVDAKRDHDKETSIRVVLACLGLVAITLQLENGYDLRSRCQLRARKRPVFELLGYCEGEDQSFTIKSEQAIRLLEEAVRNAKDLGVSWDEKPLELQASESLVKAVAISEAAEGGD